MKPDRREVEILVEEAAGAWRPRGRSGEVRSSPAWNDLDAAGRLQVFEVTRQLRAIEAAADPGGLSSTACRVLARIQGAR